MTRLLRTTLLTALVAALLGLVVPTAPGSAVAASAALPGRTGAPYPVQPFVPAASDADELARAWARWSKRGVKRYTITVLRTCYCLPRKPVVTKVRGGRVVSVTHEGKPAQLKRRGFEVERLYRVLRRAYAKAAEVRVTYRRGVPVSVYIDRDARIADEERGFIVTLRRG
ncbi:DUF6174 domain-containing protein [Nocardioides sp. C4-1]|uniref:DUF6174 domain-containing protein n=1 Tax=Nocardioides sp. C4-1 TaxID=3151851 RepID=UPI0032668538